jgi:aminoglycoside phosphotransferase (APT) family kinase protein
MSEHPPSAAPTNPGRTPVAFGGGRLRWAQLPVDLRAAVEDRLGDRVVGERSVPSGFSPGLASVLTTASGERVFVKAAFAPDEPVSARLHRAEARAVTQLPPRLPVPRALWVLDDGDWVVVAYDAVHGRTPATPWDQDELTEALDAVAAVGSVDASALDLPAARDELAGGFDGWSRLRVHPDPGLATRAPWAVERLDELVDLERDGAAAAAGTALVHGDVRADNLLVADGLVVVVDWPYAMRGAAWFDAAGFLPSVGMQGIRGRTAPLVDASAPGHRRAVGAVLHDLFRTSPHAAGVTLDAERAVVAGLAGYFLDRGRQPAVPTIPNLRPFQRAQGAAAVAWLEATAAA